MKEIASAGSLMVLPVAVTPRKPLNFRRQQDGGPGMI